MNEKTFKYQTHTFGCKVNTYDTGLIQKNLNRQGFSVDLNSDIHVLNTCAVTSEATQEAVRLVRKIKSKQPFSTIVVTGCSAQVDTEIFNDIPAVDLVVANSHKGLLPFIIENHFKKNQAQKIADKVFKSNIFHKEDLEADGGTEEGHTRSFLKIQDGCNSFCTFCVIPFARGKSRSIPMKDLAAKINALHNDGVLEVVLTGVHIGDYDDATQNVSHPGLEGLIEYLLEKTQIPRIRLTSLEPVEVTDKLLDLFKNPRLCRHFHMSIQSANTVVLKDMKRKYTQEDVIQSLQKINKLYPDAFVGMDVITGFPTETEEMFNDTYKTLSELPWTKIHIFPYSERPGTFANRLNVKVPFSERKERAKQLRMLSNHRQQQVQQEQIGKSKKVLALKDKSGRFVGLSRDYWPVEVELKENQNWIVGHEYDLIINEMKFDQISIGELKGRLSEISI